VYWSASSPKDQTVVASNNRQGICEVICRDDFTFQCCCVQDFICSVIVLILKGEDHLASINVFQIS
jgi:hypothetical protein